MKKFILSLILIIIFNCGGCAPESQTTKYPEGTMVIMKINRENICQIVLSGSYLWYNIKCPFKTNSSETTISASSSLFGGSKLRKPEDEMYVTMYVKEYEIEPVEGNN